MKVVVGNIAVVGIELSLLEKLSGLLSSDVVMSLENSITQEIAAEREHSRIERARAPSKLQSLEAGLYTLRRLCRHKLEGERINAMMLHEAYYKSWFRNSILSLESMAMEMVLRILM